MPLNLYVLRGLARPKLSERRVLAETVEDGEPVILGRDVRPGVRAIPLSMADQVSAEHLRLEWYPTEHSVLVQNVSSQRRVVLTRWGRAPHTMEPSDSVLCDSRFAARLGTGETWLYVSPDGNDWTFEYDPERYLRDHPEACDPRWRGTPPPWVQPYLAYRHVITDDHRRVVSAYHERQLQWPPTQSPEIIPLRKQTDVAHRFIHKDPGTVSRARSSVQNLVGGHFDGPVDNLMDFLVDSRLITYSSVHTMLRKWNDLEVRR